MSDIMLEKREKSLIGCWLCSNENCENEEVNSIQDLSDPVQVWIVMAACYPEDVLELS